MKRQEIIKITEEFDRESRRLLIVDLLRQQRHSYTKKPEAIKEFCTLIDLQTGVIAGSGVCPHCQGFLGRLDEFYE